MTTSEKIVHNTVVLALSRLSMLLTPFLIGFIAFLLNGWIGGISQAATNASNQAEQLKSRVDILETTTTLARADRIRYQDQVLATLVEIQRAQGVQGNQIAGIQATVEALKEQRSRGP